MSMSPTDTLYGKIVTILGGSGFVGKHLAQELLERGARVRIASRHPEKAFSIKALGDLGTVQFARCDVTKPDSLAAVLTGSDAVVNLVGAFKGKLDDIQGEGVGAIAAAAKASGAASFVHVSAIGADAGSDVAYARTKAEGEAAALAAFPEATIVRPAVIFAPDDQFVMMFGRMMSTLPVLPIFAPEAKLQPVFVDDVAAAIANAAGDPFAFGGKTFELAGPEVVTMRGLNARIARAENREPGFIELSDGLGGLIAALPFTPISTDQYKLLKAGSVASGAALGLEDLGVAPRPMGLFLERWMTQFRKHGRFGAKHPSAA
ncbi:SDR family NAD(P)-dependent oxidoreductase [Novosphingobium mangrovi (ex Hu et al. 2023)]|uniref:SDR family NAD(P)-dependent oxidoreductase n=1 Tax=Novosphingobium mangrovi (ex Hu et al. 2023) TaxID=2930094 RepID=A0ABT0ABC7_9SPHN|nr:SDR family NAD(P)-dependent oxidoreductase [Novosphingobium mangrovi (ex Hu et al. 2023)]MCJ1960496.1 SDR family NAD(P)-dependent oxidoreductase [Novosphingobium mangrovi (ex Hu et al. 2023)]